MPFDGKFDEKFNGKTPFHPIDALDLRGRAEATQSSPLFGLDEADWRGFFIALSALLGTALGLTALLLRMLDP